MYKINVLIVTYKQADVIGRNIESILQQKDYGLNKIVICDDCSPDNNWEVIQSYANKYPEYIEAYRNETNLGIYGNSDRLVTLRGEADLFCWLEGDDALCDGFFKYSQDYIKHNAIDLNLPIGIFSDYCVINPQGEKYVVKNDFVLRGESPLGAYYRNIATWRASLFSRSVIEQFQPVESGKGLILEETLFDSQWFKYIKQAFYNPIVGSIYYSGIGVSVQWGLCDNDSSYKVDDNIVRWQYMIDNGIICDKIDIFWAYKNIAYSSCLKSFSWKNLFLNVFYYYKGLKGYRKNIKRVILETRSLIMSRSKS